MSSHSTLVFMKFDYTHSTNTYTNKHTQISTESTVLCNMFHLHGLHVFVCKSVWLEILHLMKGNLPLTTFISYQFHLIKLNICSNGVMKEKTISQITIFIMMMMMMIIFINNDYILCSIQNSKLMILFAFTRYIFICILYIYLFGLFVCVYERSVTLFSFPLCVWALSRVYTIWMVYNFPTNEMSNSIYGECFLS